MRNKVQMSMDKMGHNFWGRNLNVKCPKHLKNDTTFVKNVKNFQMTMQKHPNTPFSLHFYIKSILCLFQFYMRQN